MRKQRPLKIMPSKFDMEVLKITWPPVESTKRSATLEVMRFIPHDGKAKA